jgi:adenylate cyclase
LGARLPVASFDFKGEKVDIREVGQKLNVGTLLEGSVRKAGNRLRITPQLVKVEDGYHLSSERYLRYDINGKRTYGLE